MKLASYLVNGNEHFGLVREDGIIDLGSRLPGVSTLKALLERGMACLDNLTLPTSVDYSLSEVSLLPVITNPGAIFCMGMNTHSHCAEVAAFSGHEHLPPKPYIFTRTARSHVGHETPMEKPNNSPLYDFEGEIAIIIGKLGRHISQADALSYIAGYACYNDGSLRDYQCHSPMFTAGKNFPKSGAFGPWMVTADEITDPAALTLTTRLNGAIVQEMPYADLVYNFPQIISYISEFTELQPGDVIVTGSAAGVGLFRKPQLWMQEGDVCEVEISGVGVLRNPIIDSQGINRAPVSKTDPVAAFKEALEIYKSH
ncbi:MULTISPECIES: fumarylacetoacetate hydrolase family protein [unclassified Pseudomonas]|uniref:fumarylacetoacetate hydrolase family protein n=1 Tax=unclassified Pseudomonas TaxID=196821 RepID=UPI0021C9E433|nr:MULTISPECIES: fumarylacetoacetate hydrolase family protein [unclassified Pseudomonas]MCU1733621.1 fumarylacetoacetate hydrolase family protein [Pseudomonas sp. 20P_3.2_Bac4]MCU1743285.1 fumarylacetoacetate hydrolase family protein [Pseudomonas sp. 20P_3.2_Bac5]